MEISGLTPNTSYFLKGAFLQSGSSNYFGQTLIGSGWVKNKESFSSQMSIISDASGTYSGTVSVMGDSSDSGYTGGGEYIFKVARYSGSGAGPTWSNEVSIILTGSAASSPSPSTTPGSSPVLVISPSPSSSTKAGVVTKAVSVVGDSVSEGIRLPDLTTTSEASVAGVTSSQSPLTRSTQKANTWPIILGSILVFISAGSLAGLKFLHII